jgi:subtilase family serine protease
VSVLKFSRRRAGFTALVAVAAALALAPGAATPAAASTSGRVLLPDPTPLYSLTGTPATLASSPTLTLRVYLAGRPGRAAAALAVSDPRSPDYGHYLTAAQVTTVSDWLKGQGMTITGTNRHYIAVNATIAEADAAFDTTFVQYDFPPNVIDGKSYPSEPQIGTTGSFSVPAALGGDVATVTGLEFTSLPTPPPTTSATTVKPAVKATTTSGYACSQYWAQHTEQIPEAYGRTTAPTQLCGYTPDQVRSAYGVDASRYQGKGVTVAIVMTDSSPTMLADANRYFTSHGEAGFAPGQFTVNAPASVTSSCAADQQDGFAANSTLEETIDVEGLHVTAPDAKVVYVAADCDDDSPFGGIQDLLDAATRVVDQHLANVVSGSFSDNETSYAAADGTAWDLTFEQGALEGIGFDLSSGDSGANIIPPAQDTPSVSFPSSSPWVTSVGGTSLAIGRNGTAVADYPWGDNVTEADGDGYSPAPPGTFLDGSTGGLSAIFPQLAYQKAAAAGYSTSRRVVPDVSANAGSAMLIGYTGAVTTGVYGVVADGAGTSLASPLLTGLVADAIQATGHPLGFLNPALYLLNGTGAIRDVPAVNPAHPPVLFGAQPNYGAGNDYLTTLGEDQAPLTATSGYDDETGLGAPGPSFVTAFRRFPR